ERLLSGRNRACSALLGELVEQAADLGAGRQSELVTPKKRLGGLPLPGRDDLSGECVRVEERERLERPGLSRTAEAVELAIRAVPWCLGGEQLAREPPRRVRDRKAPQVLTERDHEVVVRVVRPCHALEPVDRAAERREEAQLFDASESVRRE